MDNLFWHRRICVAECLTCEHVWQVSELGEDCVKCSSPNVFYDGSYDDEAVPGS